jgi:2-polyprenyl-6-methoxyphenol hydroxylase-like FAD-dependent oxidoreductase
VERLGGPGTIAGGAHVVAYEEFQEAGTGRERVAAILEDGRRVEGDLLVGTDGIWSKIRHQLIGDQPAHYSEYTCYTVGGWGQWHGTSLCAGEGGRQTELGASI